MTGECPTCGAPVTKRRITPNITGGQSAIVVGYAVPALIRLAQHCEETCFNPWPALHVLAANLAAEMIGPDGIAKPIEAAAEAALTRLEAAS